MDNEGEVFGLAIEVCDRISLDMLFGIEGEACGDPPQDGDPVECTQVQMLRAC